MEIIIIVLILSAISIFAIAWQELHVRREAARSACAVARSAIQNQGGRYHELDKASRDLVRHEHGVHGRINRDWSNASRGHKGHQTAGLKISHLNQSFPQLNASELFKELGRQMGSERDEVKNRIVEANKRIEEYNSALRTLPGCILSGLFQTIDYVSYKQLGSNTRSSHSKRHHRRHPDRKAKVSHRGRGKV